MNCNNRKQVSTQLYKAQRQVYSMICYSQKDGCHCIKLLEQSIKTKSLISNAGQLIIKDFLSSNVKYLRKSYSSGHYNIVTNKFMELYRQSRHNI